MDATSTSPQACTRRSSDPGRRLLAHEVAHVVQQSSGKEPAIATKSSHGAKIGAPDDPLETEADRAAEEFMTGPLTEEDERKKREAMSGEPSSTMQRTIQRQSAPDPQPQAAPLSDRKLMAHERTHVLQRGNETQPTIQREPAEGNPNAELSKAEDFLLNYPFELAADLRNGIAVQKFSLGSPYLAWSANGESVFKERIAEELFGYGGSLTFLELALAPMSEYQILSTVARAITDDQAETSVPAVAYELMPLVKRQIDASLGRIVPRYLAARNQASQTSSQQSQLSSQQSQPSLEPSLDQIPTSAPVDVPIAGALVAEVATFDELGYRGALSQDAELPKDLGIKSPGHIEFLASQGLPQWVRAENRDATAEDVAAVLYGTSTLAYKIVASAPLFGIDPESLIEEPYRRLWRESLEEAGLEKVAASANLGFYPFASPLDSVPGSAIQDEVILGQAKALAPTGATQIEVVQQMRLSLGIADQTIALAGKFGLANVLAGMRSRLDARSKKLAGNDAAGTGDVWGPQVAAQFDTLNGAADGLSTAVAELKSYRGGEIPGYIREPLHRLAATYAEAASLSEFADAGQQKLAAARNLSQSYASDVLDGALRFIHDSLKAITPDAAEQMGGDTSALVAQEKDLRSGLADVRNLIQDDPKRVAELVHSLQQKVNKLSSRVSV